jgi:hypothetical protein
MMNSKEGVIMGNNSIESEFQCIEKPTWVGSVGFGLRSLLLLKVLGLKRVKFFGYFVSSSFSILIISNFG